MADLLTLQSQIETYLTARAEMEVARETVKRELPVGMRKTRLGLGRMSQRELAELLKVDYTSISKIESGAFVPSDEVLGRLLYLIKQKTGIDALRKA
jgi:ribosome-binding protein aMBF1 (putative translation factor)